MKWKKTMSYLNYKAQNRLPYIIKLKYIVVEIYKIKFANWYYIFYTFLTIKFSVSIKHRLLNVILF